MDIDITDEAGLDAIGRLAGLIADFCAACDRILDPDGEEPEIGRIGELEGRMRNLRAATTDAYLDLLSAKIESTDEDKVVEAKKAPGCAGE